MIKKLAVFSGSRAEYGILKHLISLIHQDRDINLAFIIGGSHLSPRDGLTRREIDSDGLPVAFELDFQLLSGSQSSVAKSTGLATILASDALKQIDPDALLLIGDRYETLAVGLASFCMNVPIFHIHGGELTEGALDDGFRHCLTKLASYHFAANEEYAKRIIQLGENPTVVKCVGALGQQNISSLRPLGKAEFQAKLGLRDKSHEFVFLAVHPETNSSVSKSLQILEYSVAALLRNTDAFILTSFANLDSGGSEINERLKTLSLENSDRMLVRPSFGQLLFFNALHHSRFVIGNSSSGVIEAPILGTYCINIGNRQVGRVTDELVLSCESNWDHISDTVAHLWELTSARNYKKLKKAALPQTAELMLQDIKGLQSIKKKPFFDVDWK